MPAAKGLSPARKLALQVLVRVQRDNAFAERVLHTGFARLDLSEQDRAFCTELVFGTLRWRILLDNLLNGFLKKPLRKLPAQVQNTLRMGAYQCSFLRTPAYSAVDQALRLIGREHPAHKGLVNAVLRKFDENTPHKCLFEVLQACAKRNFPCNLGVLQSNRAEKWSSGGFWTC